MSERDLFCYCFEIPLDEAREDPEASVATIRERVAAEGCWCSEKNPSGRCCLSEMDRLAEEPRAKVAGAVSAGIGAGALAVGASACCVPVLAPLLVSILGVGGSIWAASLTPYSLPIVLVSGLVIGWAGWMIYRPRTVAGTVCKARPSRLAHIGFAVAVAAWLLALGLNLFFQWIPRLGAGG